MEYAKSQRTDPNDSWKNIRIITKWKLLFYGSNYDNATMEFKNIRIPGHTKFIFYQKSCPIHITGNLADADIFCVARYKLLGISLFAVKKQITWFGIKLKHCPLSVTAPVTVKQPIMYRTNSTDFKGKASLPCRYLALSFITFYPWDASLVFWITNPKAECLSGYLFTSGPALCLSTSPTLPIFHRCGIGKQARPSLSETQTMPCKCVCVNMAWNGW